MKPVVHFFVLLILNYQRVEGNLKSGIFELCLCYGIVQDVEEDEAPFEEAIARICCKRASERNIARQ